MLIISLPYSTIPPAGSASAVKLLSFTTVRLYSLSILLQVKLWVHAERCRSTSAAAADSSWHSGRGPVHPGPVTNSFQDKHIQTDHHLGRCMSASILGQDAWPQIASDGSIGVCVGVCVKGWAFKYHWVLGMGRTVLHLISRSALSTLMPNSPILCHDFMRYSPRRTTDLGRLRTWEKNSRVCPFIHTKS